MCLRGGNIAGLTLSLLRSFIIHGSSEFILVLEYERLVFLTLDELRNSALCIICSAAETQTAEDLRNKSQCCRHKNEISSLDASKFIRFY